MDRTPIEEDVRRVLVYARLVDPEVWPDTKDPEVSPLTVHRLRFSLEAACRIAVHEGGISGSSDVVSRLCTSMGLSDTSQGLRLPVDVDPAELASMTAILIGDDDPWIDPEAGIPPEWEEGGTLSHPLPWDESQKGLAEALASVDELLSPEWRRRIVDNVLGRKASDVTNSVETDLGDETNGEEPEVDADHDAEAGISHVGEADEGQHHEEI